MKTTIMTATLIAAASMASAADIGDNLIRSNVPTANGSAPGFLVLGEGYFVEAGYEGVIIVDATVLPEGLNSKDLPVVLAYLEAQAIDASPRLAKPDTERETTVVTIEDPDNEGEFIDVERVTLTTSRVVNGGW